MANDILAHLSAADLRRAASVREEISSLEAELQSILSGISGSDPDSSTAPRKKKKRAGKKSGSTAKKKRGKPGPKPGTKRAPDAAKPGPKPKKKRGKPGPKPGTKRAPGAAKPGPKPKKKSAKKKGGKRKFSPEAIERIREAQRKRWAEAKKG